MSIVNAHWLVFMNKLSHFLFHFLHFYYFKLKTKHLSILLCFARQKCDGIAAFRYQSRQFRSSTESITCFSTSLSFINELWFQIYFINRCLVAKNKNAIYAPSPIHSDFVRFVSDWRAEYMKTKRQVGNI